MQKKSWRGRRIIWSHSAGYPRVYWPEHDQAEKNGMVYIHRIVAAEKIGRRLTNDDQVHHEDEDVRNWRKSNLIVTTRAAHTREHRRRHGPAMLAELTCVFCGKIFARRSSDEKSKLKTRKGGPFCSRRCGASVPKNKDLVHGSATAYSYYKCRCAPCRAGQAARARKRRAALRN